MVENVKLSNTQRVQRWRKEHPEKQRALSERDKQRHQERKIRVLTYYGNKKCACVKCGFGDVRALSIDHINKDDGARIRVSTVFYKWLEDNGFPKGYQTLCMNCQFLKRDEDMELYPKFTRLKNRTSKDLAEFLGKINKA